MAIILGKFFLKFEGGGGGGEIDPPHPLLPENKYFKKVQLY